MCDLSRHLGWGQTPYETRLDHPCLDHRCSPTSLEVNWFVQLKLQTCHLDQFWMTPSPCTSPNEVENPTSTPGTATAMEQRRTPPTDAGDYRAWSCSFSQKPSPPCSLGIRLETKSVGLPFSTLSRNSDNLFVLSSGSDSAVWPSCWSASGRVIAGRTWDSGKFARICQTTRWRTAKSCLTVLPDKWKAVLLLSRRHNWCCIASLIVVSFSIGLQVSRSLCFSWNSTYSRLTVLQNSREQLMGHFQQEMEYAKFKSGDLVDISWCAMKGLEKHVYSSL